MSTKLVLALVTAGGAFYLLTRKPSPSPSALPPPVVTPTLDVGLSESERLAVHNALSKETNPANLLSFANTFDPLFPLTAAALRARAASLSASPMTGALELPCCDDCASGERPPCTPKVTGAGLRIGLPAFLVERR